jgi:hypothetical protein
MFNETAARNLSTLAKASSSPYDNFRFTYVNYQSAKNKVSLSQNFPRLAGHIRAHVKSNNEEGLLAGVDKISLLFTSKQEKDRGQFVNVARAFDFGGGQSGELDKILFFADKRGNKVQIKDVNFFNHMGFANSTHASVNVHVGDHVIIGFNQRGDYAILIYRIDDSFAITRDEVLSHVDDDDYKFFEKLIAGNRPFMALNMTLMSMEYSFNGKPEKVFTAADASDVVNYGNLRTSAFNALGEKQTSPIYVQSFGPSSAQDNTLQAPWNVAPDARDAVHIFRDDKSWLTDMRSDFAEVRKDLIADEAANKDPAKSPAAMHRIPVLMSYARATDAKDQDKKFILIAATYQNADNVLLNSVVVFPDNEQRLDIDVVEEWSVARGKEYVDELGEFIDDGNVVIAAPFEDFVITATKSVLLDNVI